MPWCPNCKTEYRDGIKTCSDCGSALEESLSLTEENQVLVIYEQEKAHLAEKFMAFMQNEGISGAVIGEAEAEGVSVSVPASQLKRAEKLFSVFSRIEAENEFSALDEAEKKKKLEESVAKTEKQKNTHVYTKASDRYKENVSTAWTFLVVGCLGLAFTVLNLLGVISFMAGPLQYIVSGIMFFSFIGISLLSFSKNKDFQAQIEKEKETERIYKNWLRSLSDEELKTVLSDEASEEENEIVLVNYLSESLVKNFPEINENFADTLADEFFNEIRDRLF